MRRDEYLTRLQQVPMFQALNAKELKTIGRQAESYRFDTGQVLVREGEKGREFFVIVDGKVTVTRAGVSIADLGPGAYFGELALLDPAPRDATVTATTPGEALVVEQRRFANLLADVPVLAWKIMVGMGRRLHEADDRPVR